MYSLKCLSILTVTKIGDCDLWRRARLQIKKKVCMKPIKLPGPSSRSPKPKQIPYTLPFEPTLHAAYSVQMNCGAYMWKGGQSKQPTGEIGALPRMRQEFADYHAGRQARKQEKLAYKRQKEHPDDADHWTGQQWSQRTRNGLKAGINQPVVPPMALATVGTQRD